MGSSEEPQPGSVGALATREADQASKQSTGVDRDGDAA